jgi:hypothetical protein
MPEQAHQALMCRGFRSLDHARLPQSVDRVAAASGGWCGGRAQRVRQNRLRRGRVVDQVQGQHRYHRDSAPTVLYRLGSIGCSHPSALAELLSPPPRSGISKAPPVVQHRCAAHALLAVTGGPQWLSWADFAIADAVQGHLDDLLIGLSSSR